jgi:hypothetical protein
VKSRITLRRIKVNQEYRRPLLALSLVLLLGGGSTLYAQSAEPASAAVSKVWVADEGNGRYRNPVLFADYSDQWSVVADVLS